MVNNDNKLYVAHSDHPLVLEPKMANRHGLIAGATGTGKTVSLQVLAESFSDLGVPCFMADMKGDLSGVYKAGTLTKFIEKRQNEFGVTFDFQPYPVQFFDVYGEQGHPMRVTVKSFGVLLFSRIMSLTDTQEGVLTAVFRICEDKNLPLDDLKDLRAALNYIGQNAKEFQTDYGNISSVSVGAIQRNLLALEEQGGDQFFGLPEFKIDDFFVTERMHDIKKGMINILAADKLYNNPKLYSAFLMWLLTSIYNKLPEKGDQDKPEFIFFFDEAHLLFDDASKALLDQIEKVVRLIRSKGVGVYFITQNPMDIPENVLGQLGNKIQHALRAFTPKDQKSIKAVAQSFRTNEAFNTEKALLELETGEALISFLDEKGAPSIVERAKMLCPQGQIGPITDEERKKAIKESGLEREYRETEDRRSAYEMLIDEAKEKEKEKAKEQAAKEEEKRKKEEAKTSSKVVKKSSNGIFNKILVPVIKSFLNKWLNNFLKTNKKKR
ncbi:MAG: DUF853 family protein [Paludibacteraceae bacterium]|jgi:hypothetical protein|nr:DUF853 family protein [Paludibacteraceae bacterium]MEE3483551.1 helicase HerA-like domain-containing protein [Bacteroidales bacterium]